MRNTTIASLAAAFGIASFVDAGILTYTGQQLAAGISANGIEDEVTYIGLDPWSGSRTVFGPSLYQFARVDSTLGNDEFTISANAALAASSPGYAGFTAFTEINLDFTVNEDAFVTFYLTLGESAPQGSLIQVACEGASGIVFLSLEPLSTTFTATLAAGAYSITGALLIVSPEDGNILNSNLLSFTGSAVAVPAPAAIAAFGVLGLVGSRRRR
jgi:hypothetical protein